MPCDTKLQQGQTLGQRKTEVREAIAMIDKLIAAKGIRVKIGPQGAVAFIGLSDSDRRSITDACIYRMITRSGSAAAKMMIARAEQLAGRNIDRSVVAHGVHSHDGGATWHSRG